MPNSARVDAHSLDQALTRLRLMYAKPEHPYYILAPDYRETSSGVASLHYLCHVLNLNGREAYICGGQVVNPDLKTPLLDPLTQKRGIRPKARYRSLSIRKWWWATRLAAMW